MTVPIIITGFPRACTSVMTYVLALHKDITLYTDGAQSHVLENHFLAFWDNRTEDFEKLERIKEATVTSNILFKRPEFYARENVIAKAKYIFMTRDKKDLINSWLNSPMTNQNKRITNNPEQYYLENIKLINSFAQKYDSIIVSMEDLFSKRKIVKQRLSAFLNIKNNFNTSIINSKRTWDHTGNLKKLFEKQKILTDLSETKDKTTLKQFSSVFTEEEISLIPSI